jgi:hypothetical protein
LIVKKRMGGLDLFGPGQEQVWSSFEHTNEPSGFLKYWGGLCVV